MIQSIQELECENFVVIKLEQTSSTEEYLLRPKNKTERELAYLLEDDKWLEKYFLTRTLKEAMAGVEIKDLVDKRKLELLK